MKNIGGLGCLILVVAGALPACGGGDEDGKGGAPFSSGLSSKPVSQLTDAEMTELCAKAGNYYMQDPSFKSGTCRMAGVGAAVVSNLLGPKPDAELQKTCSDLETACLQSRGETTQEGTCKKPSGTCTATVAEIEACVTDTRNAFSSALQSLPACGTLKSSDVTPTSSGSPTNEQAMPESCKTLEQKCPGASEGTGTPSTAAAAEETGAP